MTKDILCAILLVLLGTSLAIPCHSETLRVLERHSLEKYEGVLRVLRTGADTIMFISYDGLYVREDSTREWQKVIDCVPADEQVPFSVCDSERLSRMISPGGLWRVSGTRGDEILVLEGFCSRLYRLRSASVGSYIMEKWGKRKGQDAFRYVNVQDGLVLCGMFRNGSDETVAVQWAEKGNYRKVFRCTDRLNHILDSVGLSHTPFCIPALNPYDTTLWLAIQGYHYIYVTSMDGELLDSVPIAFDDYRRPQPLKSRMKSDAVINDWFAQWTYITSFSYAPPGYFLMQYQTERETEGHRARFSTLIWDTRREIVELAVNPLWRVAGVQSDGKIIFARNEVDSSGTKVVLYVTRIEP